MTRSPLHSSDEHHLSAPAKFVHLEEAVPDAILDLRYYSDYNFVGERIDGYESPTAFLTIPAAHALADVSAFLKIHGYRLKVYDAYRPQRAVFHFMRWALDVSDTRKKTDFYPNLDKSELFPQGYLAEKSGHSRGSTVDLTLCDLATGHDMDMGGTFDWFGPESHPDWCGNPDTGEYTGNIPCNLPFPCYKISESQFHNRMILRQAMLQHGFRPISSEWWHFTLEHEPFPNTYFNFPVK